MKDINGKEIKVGQLARVLSRYYAGYGNVEEQEETYVLTDLEHLKQVNGKEKDSNSNYYIAGHYQVRE